MSEKKQIGRTILLLAIAACFFAFLFNADRTEEPGAKFSGLTMGTMYSVEIIGADLNTRAIRELKAEVDGLLVDVNRTMSTYDKTSEISRFNAYRDAAPFEIDSSFGEVLAFALKVAEASDGAFDPTVGPLVNLWGFGSEEKGENPPSKEDVADVRGVIGYRKLKLNSPTSVSKALPDLQVDLSAIAKGYAVDRVMGLLSDRGYTNALVEVGGEIRVAGHNSRGQMWRLSVERPDLGAGIGDNIYALVQLSHGAIATSGDYRNYKTDGEKHYSHVIDPRTGSPTTNRVASVTVIAESCMVADALATAVMVLGPDDGVKLVEKFEGAETMVVVRSGSREYTDQRSQGFDRCIYKY